MSKLPMAAGFETVAIGWVSVRLRRYEVFLGESRSTRRKTTAREVVNRMWPGGSPSVLVVGFPINVDIYGLSNHPL